MTRPAVDAPWITVLTVAERATLARLVRAGCRVRAHRDAATPPDVHVEVLYRSTVIATGTSPDLHEAFEAAAKVAGRHLHGEA